MSVTGLLCARNEEICIGLTIESVKDFLDELVFVEHCSTDATEEIVTNKCKEYGIKLHLIKGQINSNLTELREIAYNRGMKTSATHLFSMDGDMIYSNIPEMLELIQKNEYDEYWFTSINLYGDIKNKRSAGINIPHLWIFRNKPGMQTIVNHFGFKGQNTVDPNKRRFIAWNLNGIKHYNRIFWRHQQWYQRQWNRIYGTNLSTEQFIKLYFNGEPSEEYKKRFILNRFQVLCITSKRMGEIYGMGEETFLKSQMDYPDFFKNWKCPFELLFDKKGIIIGRKPDLIGVEILPNKKIHQLSPEIMEKFKGSNKWI